MDIFPDHLGGHNRWTSTEEVEDTYVRTAARMSRMSLPIFVSCRAALSHTGILGRSWRPLWEPESPRLALSGLRAYHWDSLYHRMRHRPVGGIDRADASLSPLYAGWGVQNGTTGPISGVCHRPNHPCFSYETELTCRLTGQGAKWEAVLKYRVSPSTFCTPDTTADVSADRRGKAMDEPVRWVTKAEAAEELEISFSTLDRMIRKGEVEVRREGRRVFVRMQGPDYLSDAELLRRAVAREQELERTVRQLEQNVSELKLSASELERERDEARESTSAGRRP